MIVQSLLIFKKYKFYGVSKPALREEQVENKAKTGKLPDFPVFW